MDDDDEIYGGDSTPAPIPAQVIATPQEPEVEQPSLASPDPKAEIPTVNVSVKGLNWYTTDEKVKRLISSVGEISDLNMISNPKNGKFSGEIEIAIKTELPETEVLNQIKQINFGNKERTEQRIEVEVRIMKNKISSKNNDEKTLKLKTKSAPMLYEDPKNPIPKNLLPYDQKSIDNDNAKKSDDKRSSKKGDNRDRDGRDRERDRDRDYRDSRDKDRHRDRDRDDRRHKDRREYSYDYDDDYREEYRERSRRDDRDRRRRDDDRDDRDRRRRK